MPPDSLGPNIIPPSPSPLSVIYKGSMTPLSPSLEEDQVQKELSQEEELEQMATEKVSKEGQMVEYFQLPSQDTEVQVAGSIETETAEGDPSQTKITLRRSDKGKEVAEHTPSSSRGRSSTKRVPRWLRKEIMRNIKPQFCAHEEDLIELAEVLNKPESQTHEVRPLAFVNNTRD